MTQERNTFHRRAACVLLAAAALPLTPLAAQDSAPAPSAPTVEAMPTTPVMQAPTTSAPAPVTTPTTPAMAPAPTMEPVVNTTPSGNEPDAAPAQPRASSTASRAPAPRATRAARSPVASSARSAPTAPVETATAEAAPAPVAETAAPPPVMPVTSPAPAAAPETAAPAPQQAEAAPMDAGRIWPWALAGLVVLGALAFLLSRRRHRAEEVYYDTDAQEPVIAAPMAEEPVITGAPELALSLTPRRAGVREEDAVVEFTLAVENRGSLPARDVRVATWMFPSGTNESADMERMLIRPYETQLSDTALAPGQVKTVDSSVRLRTGEIETDSLLPVVVAQASYKDANGVEQSVQQSFAVGVPVDDELAHFDVENPSGLHEQVEAWPVA